jgi:hypothetical protein
MAEEIEVLKLVVERLERAGIPYMLVGSVAANYYSTPRMTRDIDVVVDLERKHAAAFTDLFMEDCYIDQRTVEAEINRRGMFNVIYNPYVLKIDFIVNKDTEFHSSALSRRREVSIDGRPVFLISPEDLVVSKLLWAKDSLSETQLGDVHNLLECVKTLDEGYVTRWVAKLGLNDVYERALQ